MAPLVSRRASIRRSSGEPNGVRADRASVPIMDEGLPELPTISPVASAQRPAPPLPPPPPPAAPPPAPPRVDAVPSASALSALPPVQAGMHAMTAHDPGSLDRLAGQLYDRLRGQLSAELLVGRERSQLLTDLT